MTVLELNNKSVILYQDADKDSCEIPEEALIVAVDNGDTLCIRQREDYIVLNRSSIPQLCKTLKEFQ